MVMGFFPRLRLCSRGTDDCLSSHRPSPLGLDQSPSRSCRRSRRTMKQRLAMLLLLFLGGVFVQMAAAAALSRAQAREAMQEFAGADTNGDGYLVPDEIMAMDEVRTQPTAAEVEPRVRPVARARARVSGSGSGFRRPKQHTCRVPDVVCQCRHVSRCAAALASKQLRATALPVVVTS